MVSPISNMKDIIDEQRILAERLANPEWPHDLHQTIKGWIDEAVYNSEDTDTGKLTEMIIQEVKYRSN